ncbi:hypothetical protein CQW23_29608 [Capsicum baccatum]|uniref:Uncharacterized protein n=1 Tax=Capsicum baccatum TaxID=33114 RepID=A0A2G2VCV1_CAPBA|nr:hypothetical protein CQW23_29608 [Capsicum baccatum]
MRSGFRVVEDVEPTPTVGALITEQGGSRNKDKEYASIALTCSKEKLHVWKRDNVKVFVQCMPNTRSSGQPLLPINPEPQLIGRMDAQRDIKKRAAQQEQARLAALAAAQVHQQNIDNPRRVADPNDEDLGDDELLNPRRDAEVATPTNRREHQARFWPECRAMQIPFDDDDDDLDGAGATELLFLRPWNSEPSDDPNMHLINFISTCKSFDNPGIGQNAIRLRLFPLSLSGEATLWLNGLTPDSITNWRSLNSVTKPVVDNAAGGSFMDLTLVQASDMLDRMTKQNSSWHTRDSEVSKGRDESDSEEEANYLNNQGGFRGTTQGNQGRNYYDKSGNKECDQGSWKNKTDRSGLYVPPGSRDTAASGAGKISVEDMMAKLLKGVEETSAGVTEVLENSAQSKQVADNAEDAEEAEEGVNDVTPHRPQPEKIANMKQEKNKVVEQTIPFPPPPFPQRLKKKADDTLEKADNRKQDKKKVVEKMISLSPPPFP